MEAHSLHTGMDQPGGVFLRKSGSNPGGRSESDPHRCPGNAGHGSRTAVQTAQQFPRRELLCRRCCRSGRFEEQPSAPLPFLELPYFNGLGGFTPTAASMRSISGRMLSRRLPWINVMANPVFGALVSESGSGCCWYGNSQSNRLTPWNNDPISDASSEAIYIRDEDSGSLLDTHAAARAGTRRLSGAARAGIHRIRAQQSRAGTNTSDFRAGARRQSRSHSHPAAADQEQISRRGGCP